VELCASQTMPSLMFLTTGLAICLHFRRSVQNCSDAVDRIGAPRLNSLNMPASVLDGHDDPQSRHKFVAAGGGDQDCGRGSILFDLLPQAVNMRLQRVRGDA
jgi:hypothetical protein